MAKCSSTQVQSTTATQGGSYEDGTLAAASLTSKLSSQGVTPVEKLLSELQISPPTVSTRYSPTRTLPDNTNMNLDQLTTRVSKLEICHAQPAAIPQSPTLSSPLITPTAINSLEQLTNHSPSSPPTSHPDIFVFTASPQSISKQWLRKKRRLPKVSLKNRAGPTSRHRCMKLRPERL